MLKNGSNKAPAILLLTAEENDALLASSGLQIRHQRSPPLMSNFVTIWQKWLTPETAAKLAADRSRRFTLVCHASHHVAQG